MQSGDRLVEEFSERLSRRIRKLRIEAGLTQKQLGERVGVPAQYISQLEVGPLHNPTIKLVYLIAHALGISAARLLEDPAGIQIDQTEKDRLADAVARLPPAARSALLQLAEGLQIRGQ